MEQKILEFIEKNQNNNVDGIDINTGINGFMPETYRHLTDLVKKGKIEKIYFGIRTKYIVINI